MPIPTFRRFLLVVFAVLPASGLVGAGVIPVTDPNVLQGLSPYDWVCKPDAISTTVNGASVRLKFKGTGKVAVEVATNHLATRVASRFPILAWTVNGGSVQSRQLRADESSVTLATGVADPEIDLYLKGTSPFEDRFNGDVPPNALKITGFAVDDGAVTKAVTFPAKVWLNIGDSIMSGDGAAYAEQQGRPPDDGWAASEDGRASYGYLLANHYGYREARIAYGGYNWGGGMAGVPGLVTLIDQRTSTVSRLCGEKLDPRPAVVLVNLGENGVPGDDTVVQSLVKLRARAGQEAKLIVMIPVSGRGRAEITRAFGKYRESTKDACAHLVDLGKITFATSDGQHPTSGGHEVIAKAAMPALDSIVRKP